MKTILTKTFGIAAVALIGCASANALSLTSLNLTYYDTYTGNPPIVTVVTPGQGVGMPYSGTTLTATSSDINFGNPTTTPTTWQPFGGINNNHFALIITGSFVVDAAHAGVNLPFALGSDDGSLLSIPDSTGTTTVLDNGGSHSALTATAGSAPEGTIKLSAGVHNFTLDYFEDYSGPAWLDLTLPAGVTYNTGQVPDGGSTVALLGCALGALGTFSRRFRK